MKTVCFILGLLGCVLSQNGYSLDPFCESFTGPTFDDPAWVYVPDATPHLPIPIMGQYCLCDDNSQPVVGLLRVIGDGDSEAELEVSSLTYGDGSEVFHWEIWDTPLNIGVDGDAISFNLFVDAFGTAMLEVFHWIDGNFGTSGFDVLGTTSEIASLSLRAKWVESASEYTCYYGVNGLPADTTQILSLPSYNSFSQPGRWISIFVDKFGGSTGSICACLDNLCVLPLSERSGAEEWWRTR